MRKWLQQDACDDGVDDAIKSRKVNNDLFRVITIEKKQYGNYICQAENRLDSTDGKVRFALFLFG